MHDDLLKLLELQDKDRGVMSVQEELAGLEPELAELDSVIVALEEELLSARKRVIEASGRRESLEGKIESYRVMQERRRQKLEWVRGAKEASTLMAEIDLARGVLAKEEAEWIRSADEVQAAEAEASTAETSVNEAREAQSGRREEISGVQTACKKRLKAAMGVRGKAADGVRTNMLTQYERVRRGRAPFALYPLHGGACGHCFTAVPLHLQQQLQQTESVSNCEACGVLMFLETK